MSTRPSLPSHPSLRGRLAAGALPISLLLACAAAASAQNVGDAPRYGGRGIDPAEVGMDVDLDRVSAGFEKILAADLELAAAYHSAAEQVREAARRYRESPSDEALLGAFLDTRRTCGELEARSQALGEEWRGLAAVVAEDRRAVHEALGDLVQLEGEVRTSVDERSARLLEVQAGARSRARAAIGADGELSAASRAELMELYQARHDAELELLEAEARLEGLSLEREVEERHLELLYQQQSRAIDMCASSRKMSIGLRSAGARLEHRLRLGELNQAWTEIASMRTHAREMSRGMEQFEAGLEDLLKQGATDGAEERTQRVVETTFDAWLRELVADEAPAEGGIN